MLLTVLLPALLCIGQSTAKVMLPPPTRYVADYADAVDTAQEDELNGLLQQLELTTAFSISSLPFEAPKVFPLRDLPHNWPRRGDCTGKVWTRWYSLFWRQKRSSTALKLVTSWPDSSRRVALPRVGMS